MGLDNPLHLAFLLIVLLLIFGAKRLPEMGRSLGGGLREFKDGLTGMAGAPATLPPQADETTEAASALVPAAAGDSAQREDLQVGSRVGV